MDKFYNRVIIGSIAVGILAAGIFMIRVKYVEAHPYDINSSSVSGLPSVGMTSLDYRKELKKGNNSMNFAFGILEDMTSTICKNGGSNMYVESVDQVNERIKEATASIPNMTVMIKENHITNLSGLEKLVATKLLQDTKIKDLVYGKNGLGLSIMYDIKGDTMNFTVKMSHSK